MVTTQAERTARKSPPSTMADSLWFAAFFATGAAIGTIVAVGMLDQGKPWPIAIFAGAFAGGYGGWFVFYTGLRLAFAFKLHFLAGDSCSDDT